MQRFATFLGVCLSLLLTSCGGGGESRSVVPPPSYGIGDAYSFDDGTVDTVVAIEGNHVVWHDGRHRTIVTTRDVMLPPLTENASGFHIGQRVVSTGLFPLRRGKQTEFTVIPEGAPDQGTAAAEQTGTCTVGDRSMLTTPAGEFATIRVDCTLQRTRQGPAVRRTYFYAPSIAYYVRRDEQVGDGPVHSIRLVRHASGNPVLSNAALLRRTEAIQFALERNVSASPVHWEDPGSGTIGSIEPVLTEHSPQLGWCREFRENLQIGARDYDLLGTACRSRAGTWLVKEITPFRSAS